jgi:hypothetical protein
MRTLFLLVLLALPLFVMSVPADAQTICQENQTRPCGSNIGVCESGIRNCINGTWGPCEGEVGPKSEIDICGNEIDDNCDGEADEGCLGAVWLIFIIVGVFLLVLGTVLYYTGYGKEEKESFVGESLGKDILSQIDQN